jgi:hypothetical protein
MHRAPATEVSAVAVPLQRATDSWADEPGYGGTRSAWEEFDAWMDAQLAELERTFPNPRRHESRG